eukprot:TRINITY_DN4231_c0_g1_i1.p1 TRINITY_DN4231_c0_g1~~TRINITY_DN4231_c0_g1_i1.p1  ORF type:complete len:1284 (-),score=450.24 TRINITY_DN4231_c0_g1_i1:34-3648(-)
MEATKELGAATQSICNDIATISTNPISKPAKKSLLMAAKTLMQRTVFLLQVADLYDIRQIIKFAQETKKYNDELVQCNSVDELPEIVRNYIFQSVSLAKIAKIRVDYIVDPILKKRLARPNDEVITVLPEKEIELEMYRLQGQSNPQMAQQTADMHDQINDAISEIIALSKETSATLFAGLDLDIPFGDEEEERLPGLLGNPDFTRAKASAEAALAQLGSAVHAGDRAAAAVAAQLVKDAVDSMMAASDDPNLRQQAEALAKAMRDLFNSMKPAVENPRNAAAMKNFDRAMDAILDSVAQLAQAGQAGAPGSADPFLDDAEKAHAALDRLRQAVSAGNATAAAEASRALAEAIEKMKSDMDPEDKARLQKAITDLANQMAGLTNSAAQAARNPKDAAAMARFDKAANDMADAMNALINNVRPADSDLSEADRLRVAVAKVNNALGGLNNATVGRVEPNKPTKLDPNEVTEAIKAVNKAVGLQAALAKMLAASKKNPQTQQDLLGATQKLSDAMKRLVEATRKVMQNPDDPAAQAELRDAMRALDQIAASCAELAMTPEDRMLEASAEMQTALSRLNDAIQRGDLAAIEEAKKDVANALKKQLVLVKPLASAKTRAGDRETLLEAARKMAEAMKALSAASDALAKNPKDPKALAEFNRALQALQDAGLVIAEGSLPQGNAESALIDNAAKLGELNRALARAVKEGRKEDANAIAYVMDRGNAKQVILAKMVSAKKNDRAMQAKLLEASSALANAMKDLSDLTASATSKTADPRARAALEARIEQLHKLNNALLNNLVKTSEAEDLVYEAGKTISEMVDRIGRVGPQSHDDLIKIADALSAQIMLAKSVADRTTDKKKKDAIEDAIDKAERVLRDLREGITTLERNPNDQNNHRELEKTLKEVKVVTRKLGDAVNALPATGGERKLIETGEGLNKDLAEMQAAVKASDVNKAQRYVPLIERKMASQARTAQEIAKKVDNPDIKSKLEQNAAKQKELIPKFVAASNKVLANPQDRNAVAEFDRTVAEIKKSNDEIINAAKRVEKGEGASFPTPNIDKITTVEGAAQAVKDFTKALKVDDTPKGRIYGASKRIAELMEKLNKAGKAGDKKEMIAAAREISACSMDIVKNAQLLAANCKDESTRDHLMSMAFAAKNFGIQLKILAAVKSATEGTDKTTENQLLTCSKGIAGSVIQTIGYAEVADLKRGK